MQLRRYLQHYIRVVFALAFAFTLSGQTSKFVTARTLGGSLRSDFSGWLGMQITVGASPITVTRLGRIYAGAPAGSHTLKIVQQSTAQDVPGASVTVSTAGRTPNEFVYGSLAAPVTLAANTTYYVVSQEHFPIEG